jgi:predicted Zn-dependent protease
VSRARTSGGPALAPAQEVAERALGASRSDGCLVVVKDIYEAEIRYANNTVTTNGLRRDRRVTVLSVTGGASGPAAGVASRSGSVDVGDLVASSEADARSSPPADDAAPLVTGEADADYADPPGTTSLGALGAVLYGLNDVFARARAEQRVIAGFARHRLSTTYLASSTGLRRRHAQPEGKVDLIARSTDGTRSAWAGQGTTDFTDVHLDDLEDRVRRGLKWAERTVELPAGRYETVLPPDAVADLVVLAGEACSGRAAEEGRNVFSAPGGRTRVGETLSGLPFTLQSGPDLEGIECSPFVATVTSGDDQSVFDSGQPIYPTTWIDGGVLRRLRYHRAGAARSGVAPTLPVDNLLLRAPGASASVDDLVNRVERGLLVTCLYYLHEVDPVTLLYTGLTRDGVYLIEGGEVIGAVNNFRFNESPIDVLARSIEAGRSERALSREWGERVPRTVMPALRVAEFNMSTVSPAS